MAISPAIGKSFGAKTSAKPVPVLQPLWLKRISLRQVQSSQGIKKLVFVEQGLLGSRLIE